LGDVFAHEHFHFVSKSKIFVLRLRETSARSKGRLRYKNEELARKLLIFNLVFERWIADVPFSKACGGRSQTRL
jgi:hypothetical protein